MVRWSRSKWALRIACHRLEAAEGLLSENELLRTKMMDLDRVLASVQEKATRVTELDARLRSLTMVSDSERSLAVGPVGELGSDSVSALPLSDEVKAELLRGSPDHGTQILLGRAERMSNVLDEAVGSIEVLSAFLSGQRALLARTPSRRPTSGFVTSTFGVRVGQKVRRGEPIGAVGNSGRSTGPHLHDEVRMRGIPEDPARFLLD